MFTDMMALMFMLQNKPASTNRLVYCITGKRQKQLVLQDGICHRMLNGNGWRKFVADDKGGSKNAEGTWSNVGGQLKGKTGWFVDKGIDSYEFKALPGGYRGLGYDAETANDLDFYGYYGMAGFWSATQVNSQNAWGRLMILDSSDFIRPYRTKDSGTSVRCVKD